MRGQVGWDEHARFMDGLVDAGFVLLGGPVEGDREVLWIVEAESEDGRNPRAAGGGPLGAERYAASRPRGALDRPARRPPRLGSLVATRRVQSVT